MIFQRWITAADSLGPFWSGFAAYSVNPLADVLQLCRAPELAEQLRQDGPSALCRLDPEERDRLAADVEPTLGAGLKSILQNEAIMMERSLGTAVPLKLVVFGKSAGRDAINPIMDREFRDQRGLALFLEQPSPRHLTTFENWRHQLLWPEPPVRHHNQRLAAVKRLPIFHRADALPNFLDLENLSRLRPFGHFHSGSATKPFLPLPSGELLRIGALGIFGDYSDVMLASAYHLTGACSAVIFSGKRDPGLTVRGALRVFLGSPRDSYGCVTFNPMERKNDISVRLSRNQRLVSQTTLEVRTDQTIHRTLLKAHREVADRLHDDIVNDWYEEQRTPPRIQAARDQAETTAGTALHYAARYLEWLEWHPEASVPECQTELERLEIAMNGDITPELRAVAPGILKRDLYRSFEMFLIGWGLRES